MAMSPEVKAFYKPRIGNIQAILLVSTATVFWAFQFFLSLTGVGEVVSEIIGMLADLIFFFWLLFLGVYGNKNQGQKLLITITSSVVELIPFINDIPVDILEVFALIVYTRIEDRSIAEQKAKAAAKAIEEQRAQQQHYREYMQRRNAQIERESEEAA
jgi:hypothetical protein